MAKQRILDISRLQNRIESTATKKKFSSLFPAMNFYFKLFFRRRLLSHFCRHVGDGSIHRHMTSINVSRVLIIMETLGLNGCGKWQQKNATATTATRKTSERKMVSIKFFGRDVVKFAFWGMRANRWINDTSKLSCTSTSSKHSQFKRNGGFAKPQPAKNYTCKWWMFSVFRTLFNYCYWTETKKTVGHNISCIKCHKTQINEKTTKQVSSPKRIQI